MGQLQYGTERRFVDFMRSFLSWAVLPLLFYSTATFIFTLPLATKIASAVAGDAGDSLLNTWILAWDLHALRTNPLQLYDANIFYPHEKVLTYSENLLATALLVSPVQVLSGNPILAHNVAILGSFILTGWSMFLLASYLTGSKVAGLIAGTVLAFYPNRFEVITQIQNLSAQWLALGMLGLIHYWRTGRGLSLLGFYLCLVLLYLSAIYYAFYLAIGAAIIFLFLLAAQRDWLDRVKIENFILGGVVASLILLPVALPYIQLNRDGFDRPLGMVVYFSADVRDFLVAPDFNRVYGPLTALLRGREPFSEKSLFPGLAVLVLAILGLFLRDPATGKRAVKIQAFFILLAIVAFVLALGPALIFFGQGYAIPLPYLLLYDFVPGFQGLRVPYRFVVVLMLALAILAAFGAYKLLSRLKQPLRPLALGAMIFLVSLEYLSVPLPIVDIPTGENVPKVYRWLAQQPASTPIVELPISDWWPDETLYMYYSTYHWQPLVNGYSGFWAADYQGTRMILSEFPSEDSIELLRKLRVSYVVLHTDRFADSEGARLVEAASNQPGLRLTERFGDDYVFAVIQ